MNLGELESLFTKCGAGHIENATDKAVHAVVKLRDHLKFGGEPISMFQLLHSELFNSTQR